MQVQKTRNGYKKVKSLFGKYEEIPEEWEIKTFEELFEFLRTGTNSRSDLQDNGEIQYIHYGDIHAKWNSILDCNVEEIPFIDKSKVEKIPLLKDGDLIIADASEDYEGTGASVLLKNVKNRKIVSGLHTIVLRTSNENISSNFKTYLNSIKFVKNQIIGRVTGISVYGLSKNNLKTIRIPLPPLKEQQKIASILSNVDSLINQTQKEIELNKKLKKGLMEKLLTKGIGHKKFKETKIGMIPNEWRIEKGKNVCSEIVVGIVIKPASLYSETGVPCLRSFNIKEDYINETDIVLISNKANESNSKSKLKKDDVLIVRTGYPGTACVVPSKFEGGNCIDLVIARPKKELDSYFLSKFINSIVGKGQVLETQGGLAQQHFNVGEMRNMLIPIPTIKEQQKITSILSNVDSQIQKQQEYKSRLEYLKKGLMQKLLTGTVRVTV